MLYFSVDSYWPSYARAPTPLFLHYRLFYLCVVLNNLNILWAKGLVQLFNVGHGAHLSFSAIVRKQLHAM